MNLSTEKKIMDLENRLVVAKGEGEGPYDGPGRFSEHPKPRPPLTQEGGFSCLVRLRV